LELVLQLAEPELLELHQECEQFVVIALVQLRQVQLELLVLGQQELQQQVQVPKVSLARPVQKYLVELQALELVVFHP
jgi:hypothetical protein